MTIYVIFWVYGAAKREGNCFFILMVVGMSNLSRISGKMERAASQESNGERTRYLGREALAVSGSHDPLTTNDSVYFYDDIFSSFANRNGHSGNLNQLPQSLDACILKSIDGDGTAMPFNSSGLNYPWTLLIQAPRFRGSKSSPREDFTTKDMKNMTRTSGWMR